MLLGWVIIVIILQQGPFQIMPAVHVGRPPMEYPPARAVRCDNLIDQEIKKKALYRPTIMIGGVLSLSMLN